MRNTKKTVRRSAVVGGTVAALIGGGVAFAAWTSTGTGSGSAAAGSEGVANLPITAPGVSDLFPTGHKDQTLTITNNNPYPVALDTLAAGDVQSSTSACDVANIHAELAPDQTVLGTYIAPKNTVQMVFRISMTANADNGCKGATFTVPYTVSGHSTDYQ